MIFFFKVLLLLFSSVRKIRWTGPGFNKSAESFGVNLQSAMKTVKATCIVLSCNVIMAFLTYKLKTRQNTPWWLWREAPNFRIRQLVGTLFTQASLWDTSMILWIGKVLFCCFSLNKNLRSSFNWKIPASIHICPSNTRQSHLEVNSSLDKVVQIEGQVAWPRANCPKIFFLKESVLN